MHAPPHPKSLTVRKFEPAQLYSLKAWNEWGLYRLSREGLDEVLFQRVYFQEANGSLLNVMQVSALGGESERVPVPYDFVGLTGISIAQSKLLLQTPINQAATLGKLWAMPLPVGELQSLGISGFTMPHGVPTRIGSTTRLDPISGWPATMKASSERF